MSAPLDRSDLIAIAIVSGTLLLALGLVWHGMSLAAAAVIIASSASALMIGRAFLSFMIEPAPGFRPFAEFILGTGAMSLIILLAVMFLGMTAATGFLLCGAIAVAAIGYNVRSPRKEQGWAATDLLVLLAICAIGVVWSWQAIEAMPTLEASGRFPVWADYIFQANEIAHFAQLGWRPVFYHYGSLMLPAAVSALAQVPALIAATALWTVLGFIIMGMGAYAFGVALFDRPGGITAAGALLLVPDAAHYGLRNGFFDFHWLEQITTGGNYATGTALVALALGVLAKRHQSGRMFCLAVAATLLVLPLRSQIFLPLAIAQALLLALFWRPARGRTRAAGLAALALVFLAGALIAEAIPRAPHLLSDWPPHPMRFAIAMLSSGPPGYVDGLQRLFSFLPLPLALPLGIAYLLLASAGGMLLACLVGFVWCGQRGRFLAERWVPMAAIAAFVVVVALIPPTITIEEPTEMQHRQFVLLYAVLAAWSGGLVGAWASAALHRHATPAVSAAAALLLPVPFLLSPTVQHPAGFDDNPNLGWTKPYVGLDLPPGMLEAATFLREQSAPRDVVMLASSYHCGPLQAIFQRVTLRAEVCDDRSASPESTTPTRPPPPGSVPARMLAAPDFAAFQALAREQGVDWFFAYAAIVSAPWMAEKSLWPDKRYLVIRARGSD
jgi:hypothetical protein